MLFFSSYILLLAAFCSLSSAGPVSLSRDYTATAKYQNVSSTTTSRVSTASSSFTKLYPGPGTDVPKPSDFPSGRTQTKLLQSSSPSSIASSTATGNPSMPPAGNYTVLSSQSTLSGTFTTLVSAESGLEVIPVTPTVISSTQPAITFSLAGGGGSTIVVTKTPSVETSFMSAPTSKHTRPETSDTTSTSTGSSTLPTFSLSLSRHPFATHTPPRNVSQPAQTTRTSSISSLPTTKSPVSTTTESQSTRISESPTTTTSLKSTKTLTSTSTSPTSLIIKTRTSFTTVYPSSLATSTSLKSSKTTDITTIKTSTSSPITSSFSSTPTEPMTTVLATMTTVLTYSTVVPVSSVPTPSSSETQAPSSATAVDDTSTTSRATKTSAPVTTRKPGQGQPLSFVIVPSPVGKR